jgi:hypothetical protein
LNRVSGWQWAGGLARSIGYDGHAQIASYSLGELG